MTEQRKTRKLSVALYPVELAALVQQAMRERRDTRDQAAWNVHFALVTLGFLKDEDAFEKEE